jgi:hypothetical protein
VPHDIFTDVKAMNQEFEASIDQGEEEIAAIREVRHRLSERFGHDPYRVVAYLMELQKEHPEKLVPAPEIETSEK